MCLNTVNKQKWDENLKKCHVNVKIEKSKICLSLLVFNPISRWIINDDTKNCIIQLELKIDKKCYFKNICNVCVQLKAWLWTFEITTMN